MRGTPQPATLPRVSRSEKTPVQSTTVGLIPYLNAGLVLLIGFFLVFYIIRVNRVADLRYRVSLLKSGLAKENLLTQSFLDQEQSSVQTLMAFAHSRGMVEVKNYDSFFEESGVALK